jgi:hypothetical protein
MPGVSVFKRKGDKIMRVADTAFMHGDDFCSVWSENDKRQCRKFLVSLE